MFVKYDIFFIHFFVSSNRRYSEHYSVIIICYTFYVILLPKNNIVIGPGTQHLEYTREWNANTAPSNSLEEINV